MSIWKIGEGEFIGKTNTADGDAEGGGGGGATPCICKCKCFGCVCSCSCGNDPATFTATKYNTWQTTCEPSRADGISMSVNIMKG
ncbi:MAG: hypothetical protein HY769_01500 [Candidatus Stahlbacteria bacterium]|nr:hypothetical protein [Candidatus Stahlbacteria bacterium]